MCVCLCVCVFTQFLCYELDIDLRSIFGGVRMVLIQCFPSPKLVTLPRIKIPVYCSPIDGGKIVGFMLIPRALAQRKGKQPRLGLELGSLSLFPTVITVTLRAHSCVCV